MRFQYYVIKSKRGMKAIVLSGFLMLTSLLSADVNQIIASMTLEEKIGQLFIMRFNLDDSQDIYKEKKCILAHYQVGGVIFLCPWNPEKQFEWTQKLKAELKVPPLYCADAEYGIFCADPERWGHKIRDSNIIRYPQAMTLGAIKNNTLIYEFGKRVAQDCRAFNVHMDFAPVVDVNNNSDNPIIHMRSFGDDPHKVAQKATAYFKGLQDGGVLTCAKHFCGHGDTAIDSHKSLPEILHTRQRLNEIELIPFKHVIDKGIDAVMTAHIHVPTIDNRLNRPISLSYNGSTELLKDELGFKGLVVTDALDMAGVNKYFAPGEIEKEAFLAGADLLICSVDIAAGINAIKKAVDEGEILEQEIDERVYKILMAKERFNCEGLYSTYEKVLGYLNNESAHALKRQLYENAVTIVYDYNELIPLKNKKIAVVEVGNGDSFCQALSEQKKCDRFSLRLSAKIQEIQSIEKKLEGYDIVLFVIHDIVSRVRPSYGLSDELIKFMNNFEQKKLAVLFGTPYSLDLLDDFDVAIVAYDNDPEAQRAAANIINGVIPARGELPISYSVPKKRSP